MLYEMFNTKIVSPLFCRWEETLICSCLQKIMGKVYADDPEKPKTAIAVLGDFTFFCRETECGIYFL